MYRAKNHGGDDVRAASASDAPAASGGHSPAASGGRSPAASQVREPDLSTPDLASSLRGALAGDELVLHYQPRVEGSTGRIVGAEALLRWRHPDHGLLPPARFLPLAQELSLLVPIGNRVLREACTQAKAWRAARPDLDFRISVNLSGHEFGRRDVRTRVRRALAESGLEPAALEIELTENGLMRDESDAVEALTGLRNEGVRISIDDFGTGYSSLDRLRRFPISGLKIDRRFVEHAPLSPDDGAIVAAIVTMAHGMGLEVIAEGVETRPQAEFLRSLECDEMQGYLFGAPMPPAEFAKHLASGRALGLAGLQPVRRRLRG
jgi:EAL domain-containing protein (putative c-di-GMP-specific phosphodiesterase class I)